MKKFLFIISSCLLILSSCNDETNTHSGTESTEPITPDIILQARNISGERPRLQPRLLASERTTPLDHPFRYLGYTYVFGNYIVGHPDNIRRQIVDVEALYNDPSFKDFTDVIPIIDTDSKVKAYSSYDRFEKNTEMTKKVESGFSLNLGLFKFGRKKTVNEIFKTTTINLNQELTGEVDLLYLHSRVWLDNVSGVQKKIAADYVKPSFTFNLFTTPIAEMIDKWGAMVVCHYYTGGRANSLYVANYIANTSFESREKDMEKHLNASFAWKSKTPHDVTDSIAANFGRTYKNGNDQKTESQITKVHNRVKLSGGDPEFQLTTKASTVSDNYIDLSGWLKSLKDTKTHVVVDLADEGLVGLDKFVLEENLKRRIRDTHLGYLTETTHETPYIEIVKVLVRTTSNGEQLSKIAAVLNTRHGDKIILTNEESSKLTDAELRLNNDNSVFMSKANNLMAEKSKYFQCEIRTNTSKVIKPYLRVPLVLELNKFNESSVYKYTNPKTQVTYIYDIKSRTALSYYNEEWIPWDYGMLEWIENIPTKSIPMSSLYQLFTIIGL